MITKNEQMDIRPMMNGYKIEHSYRERGTPTPTDPNCYDYCNDQYMFATWDEVVEFIKDSKMEIPPAKI